MQENRIDLSEWTEFWRQWDQTIKKLPGMKEDMLEKAGDEISEEVRRTILTTGINDVHGRVRTWQNWHVGSGAGYVAVRSDSIDVMSGGGGHNLLNAGALTNFLTSGHRIRLPSGRAKRYLPRARMTYVPGAEFYRKAGSRAVRIALDAANAYLKNVQEALMNDNAN